MTALAEHTAVPFHLGLTEPIDETAVTSDPALDGAYDPVEQIWKLPAGTPLTGLDVKAYFLTYTYSIVNGTEVADDGHADA